MAHWLEDPYATTYGYVNGRPTLFVDPAGEFGFFGAVVGAVVGGVVNSAVYLAKVAFTDTTFAWSGLGAAAGSGRSQGGLWGSPASSGRELDGSGGQA